MCKIALCLFYVLSYSIGKGQEARHYSQKYNSTRTSTKTFDWFLFVCRFTSAWQYFPAVKKYNSTRTSGKHSINFCFVCLSVGLITSAWEYFPTVKNTTQRGRLRKHSINFFQFVCLTSTWEYFAHHYWWSKDCI